MTLKVAAADSGAWPSFLRYRRDGSASRPLKLGAASGRSGLTASASWSSYYGRNAFGDSESGSASVTVLAQGQGRGVLLHYSGEYAAANVGHVHSGANEPTDRTVKEGYAACPWTLRR